MLCDYSYMRSNSSRQRVGEWWLPESGRRRNGEFLVGRELQCCKMKKFCAWIVVIVVKLCQLPTATKLNTFKILLNTKL